MKSERDVCEESDGNAWHRIPLARVGLSEHNGWARIPDVAPNESLDDTLQLMTGELISRGQAPYGRLVLDRGPNQYL